MVKLTSADWRELWVEAGGEAGAPGGPHQQVALVTHVLDAGVHVEVGGDERGVGRLLGLAARRGSCGEN